MQNSVDLYKKNEELQQAMRELQQEVLTQRMEIREHAQLLPGQLAEAERVLQQLQEHLTTTSATSSWRTTNAKTTGKAYKDREHHYSKHSKQ